ncbi:cysteine-rich RLK (RECEPTOR-like protein kinase) 8 [Euphorbia peplus]|nr:cysteine-rich RLK (RECEPTOR-like protein kinase) 8 [Euphorbia peplus]
MASTSCELKWLQYILSDFGIQVQLPIIMHCDSKAAIALAQNPVSHDSTKHINIDCHLIREHIANGFIVTPHISTTQQLADLFTKALSLEHMLPALIKMGVTNADAG